MARQCRFEALLAMLPQPSQRTALIPPHQAGIADYIGCKYCRQSALLTGQWILAASHFRS